MSEFSRASLQLLRKSASQLNETTEKANETVRELEEFLSECRIGEHAIEMGNVLGENGYVLERMQYQKFGQKYRIALSWECGDSYESKPWSDCSREQKLAAMKFLPLLLSRIAQHVESQVQLANNAAASIAEVNKLLSVMKEGT